ncbi:MAG: hypothetical protein KIT09_00460 [Bryobacteraceae bacterium]|nr:hypothetical protein [Bryobacteraceae bacterium]
MASRKLIVTMSLLVAGAFIACNRQTTSNQPLSEQEQAQAQPPLQEHQLTTPGQSEQQAEAPAPPAEAPPAARSRDTAQQPRRGGETGSGGLRERELEPAVPATQTPPARAHTEERPGERETRPPAPPPARTATLEAGAAIVVRTTSEISTKTAADGERFTAHLEKPITSGGWVIAPRGAQVEGVVADTDPGGRVKGRASLTLRLTRLTTADRQTIAIDTTSFGQEAKSGVKKDAAKVGIASGVGAAIGAIAGGGKGAAIGAAAGAAGGGGVVAATRGEAATIPAESVLTFELVSPVKITEKR